MREPMAKAEGSSLGDAIRDPLDKREMLLLCCFVKRFRLRELERVALFRDVIYDMITSSCGKYTSRGSHGQLAYMRIRKPIL